jgi:hypothetical protein
MVAAAIRVIFAQPGPVCMHAQRDEVARMLAGKFPTLPVMLHAAAEDLLVTAVSSKPYDECPVAERRYLADESRSDRPTTPFDDVPLAVIA